MKRSDDGLTYTFTLREGITFHNGKPLTSKEVVWSWERYVNPATEWRCLNDVTSKTGLNVEKVTAVDELTVEMKLSRPNALFLDTLARPDCGGTAILHPDSLNADGGWNAPVGTGPFTLKEWRRGQYISLAKYADYQSLPGERDGLTGGKRPLVDEVQFVFVTDPSVVKAGLISGAIDAAQIAVTDTPEIKAASNLNLIEAQSSVRLALLFQTNNKLFGNVRMRQAVEAALDFDQIVDMATNGQSTKNNSTIQAKSPYYSDIQKKAPAYQPEKVAELLKEAGYSGEPVVITTNNRKTDPNYNIAIIMQSMLQASGINAQIEIVEWATHMDKFLSGNYQMMVHSYSARFDPALSFEHFTGPKKDQPRKVWDSTKAQELIKKASEISDKAERQKLFDELHELMLTEVPLVMLFNPLDPWGVAKRVEGFVPWEGRARAWEVSVKSPE